MGLCKIILTFFTQKTVIVNRYSTSAIEGDVLWRRMRTTIDEAKEVNQKATEKQNIFCNMNSL